MFIEKTQICWQNLCIHVNIPAGLNLGILLSLHAYINKLHSLAKITSLSKIKPTATLWPLSVPFNVALNNGRVGKDTKVRNPRGRLRGAYDSDGWGKAGKHEFSVKTRNKDFETKMHSHAFVAHKKSYTFRMKVSNPNCADVFDSADKLMHHGISVYL